MKKSISKPEQWEDSEFIRRGQKQPAAAAPQNIELATATQNLEILSKHPMEDTVLYAMANEREIGRLADRIRIVLETLARDYATMAELFCAYGETNIYNIVIELPELKAQLRCRKDARNLYAALLQ